MSLTKTLKTTCGKLVLVDDDIYERYQNVVLSIGGVKYPSIGTGNNRIQLHRIVAGDVVGFEIDHINYNTLDCRRSNLRHVTHSANAQNTPKRVTSTAPYKGVQHIHNGWQARLSKNGRRYTKSGFHTAEDAARYYNQLVDIHFPGGYKNPV